MNERPVNFLGRLAGESGGGGGGGGVSPAVTAPTRPGDGKIGDLTRW